MAEKRSCAGGIAILAVMLTLIVNLNCFADELSITSHEQLQNQWCWAACSESVLNFYGLLTQQCEMANYAFGQSNCCNNVVWPDGTGTSCDRANALGSGNILADWLQLIWGMKNAQSVIKNFGNVDSSYRPYAVSTKTVEEQISRKAPWIMGWAWTSGGGHALLGYGFSSNLISYMDPWPTKTRSNILDYSAVKKSTDHEWNQTLLMKPKAITFVIDDTGSMGDNIDDAKAAAEKVIDDNAAAGMPFFYTLISFEDGDGVVWGQTLDADEIKSWINDLSAWGGDDCPESSLTAVRQAANLVPESEIYLMTDADSNSYGEDGTYATVGEVLYTAYVLATQKVVLNPIIYGDCGYSSSLTLTSSDLSRQQGCKMKSRPNTKGIVASSTINSGVGGYEYLSTMSGGLFFNIPMGSTAAATDMILKHASMDNTIALYDGNGPATYNIPVDSTISNLNIILNAASGSSISLQIKNPSGTIVDDTSSGVSVLSLGSNTLYLIKPPALVAGNWTATIGGLGTYRLSGVAATTNQLDYVGETSQGIGGTLKMKAGLTESVTNISFGLTSTDGSSTLDASLYDDGLHDDGYAKDLFYAGTRAMNVADTYRFKVTGDGYFQRMYPNAITVGYVEVVAPASATVLPGTTLSHTFQVKNLGTTEDTYDVFASSSLGWDDFSGLPTSVTIAGGGTEDIVIPVNVPATATLGQVDRLSLQAVSQASPLINGTDETETSVGATHNLIITKTGTGSGTVSSDPTGINCGATCTAQFDEGANVTLTATADSLATFTGWSGGGCSGVDPCVISLNSDATVSASFVNCTYAISPTNKTSKANGGTLSITVIGTGRNDCPVPLLFGSYDWIAQSGTITWKKNKGKVKLAIQKNTSSQSRSGIISIGGKTLTINEDGAKCQLTALKPASGKYLNMANTGSFDVSVSPQDCSWNVATTFPWIYRDTTTRTGNGTVAFHIDANASGKNRNGNIDVSLVQNAKKKTFKVKQSK
jgi:hypothetical protein